MKKVALITGVTGQDGSYMADFLLEMGYTVFGTIRRNSSLATYRIDYLQEKYGHGSKPKFKTLYADLSDGVNLTRILQETKPNEIYNFAAQSHVKISFEVPEYTANIDGLSVLRFVEAVRQVVPEASFYQAGTSEMFGNSPAPQMLSTVFDPQSPYASAKCFAHHTIRNFRDAYGLNLTNGIAFNHESPRRGKNFVTQKIVQAVCEIKNGVKRKLHLGNLHAKRDWGYAPEYIKFIWSLNNLSTPTDTTLATGIAASVRQFADYAFQLVNLNAEDYLIGFEHEYMRLNEVENLMGDGSEIESAVGRKFRHDWRSVCEIMVEAELAGKEKKILWDTL